MGQDWGVKDKLALLNGMNAIKQMVIVGIFSADRMQEYTSPRYEAYGRSVVEEIKPYIDAHFRTRPGPRHTGVMGSSLGGVVSFYMGWQWPAVFGNVASLSGTFSHKDNLVERVLKEAQERTLLSRQRMAWRQLRGGTRDGGRAGGAGLSLRARFPIFFVSQRGT